MSEPVTPVVMISCAKDIRPGFGGNLLRSLQVRGFSAKLVEDNHQQEQIQGFKIFIIVLSSHYATCSSRMNKLTDIVNKNGTAKDRVVFSVFFKVEPSDVRHQKGGFEIALDSHKNHMVAEDLQRWIKALEEVADISGWTFNWSGNTHEYLVIENIVEKVSDHIACSVRLNGRVEKVNDLLKSGSDDRKLGVLIYGEAGIGKTTIACGVCRSNGGKFAYNCFLEKVGENLRNHGPVGLTRMLLSKMIGDNDSKFGTEEEILRKKGKQKGKSLLVFEDIFDQEQLEYIVKVTTNYFSSDSKVIITAEKNCFLQCPEIEIYEVERFVQEEATDLFNLKAFNSWHPEITHLAIIPKAVTIASGVPFILELIGAYCRGKSVEQCYILDQYKNIPNEKKKQMIVQMSYDDLSKDKKNMLSHIAFNLNGQKKATVEDQLHPLFGDRTKDGINVLLDKSLIKINEQGLVTMHDLTLNMVKDMEYGKQEDQPASNYGSMCDLMELDEKEYVMQETQPATNDGSIIYESMECEYQCSYQDCSSSPSQDPS